MEVSLFKQMNIPGPGSVEAIEVFVGGLLVSPGATSKGVRQELWCHARSNRDRSNGASKSLYKRSPGELHGLTASVGSGLLLGDEVSVLPLVLAQVLVLHLQLA